VSLDDNQLWDGRRIVGLDAMRVILALLGIFLHAGIAYMVIFPGVHPTLFGVSQQTNLFFDWWVLWIHAFRMPAFFFLSGFFSYLIFKKVHFLGLSISRIKRIAVPFLVLLLLPVAFGYAVQFLVPSGKYVMTKHNVYLMIKEINSLWFLYYLFLLDLMCFAGILLFKGFKWTMPNLSRRIKNKTNNRIFYTVCISCVILLPIFMMLSSSQWFIPTDMTIIPNLQILSYYAIFFLLGWGVQTYFKSLVTFAKRYRYYLLVTSFLSSIVYLFSFHHLYPIYGGPAQCAAIVFYNLSAFAMLLGILGWCLNTFRSYNPYIRYLADATYWIYLSQVPVILMLHTFLEGISLPLFLKYSLIVLITLSYCLLSYQLLIRNRKIFRYIDGNRGVQNPVQSQ